MRVFYLLPEIPDDASPELKAALALRNAATVAGACECGGELAILPGPQAILQHETGCPAGDDNVRRLLREHGVMVP